MLILLLIVAVIAVDVVTAQTPIENRITICDGRTVTPFPNPTWTPDPITAVIDKPVGTCTIGAVHGATWACIELTSIWECAQFALSNGDESIWINGCPRCLDSCVSCEGISYLPLIMK